MDPTSQKLLAFLPHANVNPGNSATPANNLQIAQNNTVDKNQVTERIDFNQNSKSQWFGRFGWTSEDTVTPLLPQQGQTLGTNSKQYMVSNAWVLSATKVNEVRFGYTTMFNAVADVLSGKEDVVKELGLPFTPEVPQSWGVPAVSMTNGLSGWGDNTSAPFVINDKITQVLDNFSWNHGKHSIRFGGEYRYDVYNQYGNQYTRGNPQFNGNYTANPQTLVGGNSAADFVLGDPYRLDLALQLAQGNDTANSLAFYIDDTYKMTPKLTITVGSALGDGSALAGYDAEHDELRFQGEPSASGKRGSEPISRFGSRGPNKDFYQGLNYLYVNTTGMGQPGPVAVARDNRLGDRMVNTDWNNFAPRFGIAYSPSSKWSIRTGFGVFFSQETANSKFDVNRGSAGRLTDLPDPKAVPTLSYANSYDPSQVPYQLNPGLTWAIQHDIAHSVFDDVFCSISRDRLAITRTLEVGYQGVQDRKLQNQYNADCRHSRSDGRANPRSVPDVFVRHRIDGGLGPRQLQRILDQAEPAIQVGLDDAGCVHVVEGAR